MFGRQSRPARHRNGSLLLDDETAERLGADGRALLGTFTEAEVEAVGVRGSLGRPETEATSSPLDRAGPFVRESAVASALVELTARGDVEAAKYGTAPERLVVHGPLRLLRDATAGYAAAVMVVAMDPAYGYDAVLRVDRAVEVVGPRNRPLLLDQRLDTVTGRTDVVLWTPEAYAAALAAEAFTDPVGERPHEEGSAVSMFGLQAAWVTTTGRQAMALKLERREGADTGRLETTVEGQQMPSASGGRSQVEQVLANLLQRMLRT